MSPRPTIYDVAREAGVAPSTVSRAYSRPGRVNADTARRVFEAAERLGYRAGSLEGRGMRDRPPTTTLGLVIADITNPFYGEIIRGAFDAARAAGYMLILSHTGESAEIERTSIESELAKVDAIVIASSRMNDSALRMIAKQRAVVLLNRVIPEVCCVVTDNPRGVKRAAEHLGMLGHTGIVYVAGPERSWADGVRWRSRVRPAWSCSSTSAGSARTTPRCTRASAPPAGWSSSEPLPCSPTTTSWRSG